MKFDRYPHEQIADHLQSGAIIDTVEYPGITIHVLEGGRMILDIHSENHILIQRPEPPKLRLVG
jgi:hypothetical protein